MPVRFQRQGNPLYPLPPDYHQLSPEGQKKARLNAVMLQETPEDLVIAWSFFRKWYLEPSQSGWYKRWKPSPPLHYLMIQDVGQYPLNAWAAPRAFSKTTVIRELIMFLMLTRPNFSVLLVQATDKKAKTSLAVLKRQFESNPLLIADFGQLKGPKGDRPWSTEQIVLPNGSGVVGLSVNSTGLRGERPDLCVIDDPEYDDETGEDPTQWLEDFEVMLFKVLLPMMEDGTSTFWIGTLLRRDSFLYKITRGSDPRFKFWNTRVIKIQMPDGTYAWEAKWGQAEIEVLRQKLGESAFQSEYMNEPGLGSKRILTLHPTLGTYRVEGAPEKEEFPLLSDSTLVYDIGVREEKELRYVRQEKNFGEWASELYRLICVDYARKVSDTADYSCVMVMGFDREDVLCVLDGFLGRVQLDPLIGIIFDLAKRWQVRVVGCEAVSVQEQMADRTAALMSQMAAGTGYIPRVFPIKYARRRNRGELAPTRLSKADRIAGLEWRFNTYRIRLPDHRREEKLFRALYHQIDYFTMDLSLLAHDDAIDTLAMHQHLVRRQGSTRYRDVPNIKTPRQMLAEGQMLDEAGLLNVMALRPGELNMGLVKDLMKYRQPEPVRERDLSEWIPQVYQS